MDTVVLVHGLWRTHLSFGLSYLRLPAAGFRPYGIRYPSRRLPIEELAEFVAARLPDGGEGRVHFLAHSLGGLVVRRMLCHHRLPNLGRVVMLSPPHQGSQLARRLKDRRLFRLLAGPIGQQLASGADEMSCLLGPVDYELGIITGQVRRRIGAKLINGPSDGRVAHDEARVEGMTDFLVMPVGHLVMISHPGVLDQAVHFFRHGAFRRVESFAAPARSAST